LGKYRGKWNPSFVDDYLKLRNSVNREYGEREYDDKFRVERSPGMLKQPEVDYGLEFKPYVAENKGKGEFPLEIDEKSKKENVLDRIEELERERVLKDIYKEAVPLPAQKEQSLPKVQKHDELAERSEHTEPLQKDVKISPMEKELQNIELELLKGKQKQVERLELQPYAFKISKNESEPASC